MTTPLKKPEPQVRRPAEPLFKRLTRQQLFIPFAALALLVLFSLIAERSCFAVSIRENSLGNPVLSGHIISVLDNASELVLLAIGMSAAFMLIGFWAFGRLKKRFAEEM